MGTRQPSFQKLTQEIRACQACKEFLPHKPRPVFQLHPSARLLIIGQAPGSKVHQSGIPWSDASGERLRAWLDIPETVFYDKTKTAILPMGLCYPGSGEWGDLPPRRECFQHWHFKVTARLPQVQLTLLVGNYAQQVYLKSRRKKSLTETVRSFEEYLPHFLPLPHPSPLNNIWLHKNRWFERDVLPALKSTIHQCFEDGTSPVRREVIL